MVRLMAGDSSNPVTYLSRPIVKAPLAIRYDRLIREGIVRDQSELARLANVSQPRMTQIMRLLSLAPDIQEKLLFLPRVVRGKPAIHERMLRPIAAEMDWGRQREMWRRVRRG